MPEPTEQAGAVHTHPRVQGLIEREVRAFIASDTVANVSVRVNTRAQQTLVRVLKVDRTGAVSMQGDQVSWTERRRFVLMG